MRTLIVTSLLALALVAPGCKEPDPNQFETHLEQIQDPAKRAQGFIGLERLTKTIVSARDNDDLIQGFVDKVIPVFDATWDDAKEQQENMLVLLRDVGRPEAHVIWSKAVGLDGSTDARKKTVLALNGIKKARAKEAAPAVSEALKKVIAKPSLDDSEKDPGELRILMAETLGALGDSSAVPALIELLEQDPATQPVVVHRAAADALGRIGDPAGVDALLAVQYRVPDSTTTTNIGERVKAALAGIGEPAVPKVMQMLKGEHEAVQKAAAANGVDQNNVSAMAVQLLGVIGSPTVVEDLVNLVPTSDCKAEAPKKATKKKKKKGRAQPEDDVASEPDDAAVLMRAVTANALGMIGDPKGAPVLCGCLGATKNPSDTFPMMEALGRMGGEAAVSCLTNYIKSAEYDSDSVEKEFVHEPRWEAARFAILAATPEQLGKVKAAMASNREAKVKEELAKWEPGIAAAETCGADKGCYLGILKDTSADWFAREKAAYEVARFAPGDVEAATAIAQAFKTRNPDARVSMAWLARKVAGGKSCPECVDAFESVLEAEKMSMDATYQLSVLMVRYAVPSLSRKD